MTTAIRYQSVTNSSNPPAVMTASDAPSGDGSDRAIRVIKRVLSTIDIGGGAGQTRGIDGCIIATLPAGINILFLQGISYKLVLAGPPPKYRMADGLVYVDGDDVAHAANIDYLFNTDDNTLRVFDNAATAQVQLAAGDIVSVTLTFGPNP